MDEEVKANILLELDNTVNFLLDEIVVLALCDGSLGELSTCRTDLLGLLKYCQYPGRL